MMDRRDVLFGGIFLAGLACEGALSLGQRRPPAHRPVIAGLLPMRFGRWEVSEEAAPLLPQRDVYVDAIYDDYVARCYVEPDAPPVILLIAHGGSQGGGIEVHRPENCYPPYGYALSPSRRVRLTLGRTDVMATALAATLEGQSQQILYWVRIGDQFPATKWQAALTLAEGALTGRALDGILVRMSAVGADVANGQRALARFARELLVASPPALAELLVGGR